MAKSPQLYMRGLEWWCEEGHYNVVSTSFYRLTKEKISCIVSNLNRGNGYCRNCRGMQMPDRIGESVRL